MWRPVGPAATTRPGRAGTTTTRPRREHAEGGVARGLVDPAAEPGEVAGRAGPADGQRLRAAAREPQDRRELPRRQPPRGGAELHPHRPGERGPHLRGDRRQVGGAHRGRVDPHGQRDAVAALEARERAHDRVAGGFPVERHAGARGQDDGLQAVQDDCRVAVRAVDGLRHPADLEDERPFEHARRRRDVGAEDAHADPAEASDRADAAALVERQLDGRAPVGLDPEADRLQPPVVPARGEGHGHFRQGVGAALELRARLGGGQPADVDAVDLDACRDPVRRACEDESEHGAADRQDDRQHSPAAARAAPWNGCDVDCGPGPAQSQPRRARQGV